MNALDTATAVGTTSRCPAPKARTSTSMRMWVRHSFLYPRMFHDVAYGLCKVATNLTVDDYLILPGFDCKTGANLGLSTAIDNLEFGFLFRISTFPRSQSSSYQSA